MESLAAQNVLTENLLNAFPDSKLYDRCAKPTHGYRAKHVVVRQLGKWIEIQVGTTAQHGWALLSEKATDIFRQELKCGVGSAEVLEGRQVLSALIAEDENAGTCLDAAQMMTMVLDATEFLQQHNLSNPR